MSLTEQVYRATSHFPSTERFGLVVQMRRSSVSVPSNIAEGCGRRNPRELNRFLDIAYASMFELETQIEMSHRLGYMPDEVFRALLRRTSEVGRMLNGLKKRVRADD